MEKKELTLRWGQLAVSWGISLIIGVLAFWLIHNNQPWNDGLVTPILVGLILFVAVAIAINNIIEKKTERALVVLVACAIWAGIFFFIRLWIADNIHLFGESVATISAAVIAVLLIAIPFESIQKHDDTGMIIYTGILAIGVVAFLLVHGWLISINVKSQDGMLQLAFAGIPVFGFTFAVLNVVYNSSCPSCEFVLTKQQTKAQEISRKKGYKTVERQEKNSSGDVIRRWNEQVRVLTVSTRYDYKCTRCNHTWSEDREKEYESFDE